ncbi:MAG: MFS transporter [Bdellovibrionales bacterium]
MTATTLQRSLRLSLFDSFLYALMVGAGESYLPAYVLSLGLSEWMAGLIATMPLLSGAFLQILSTEALRAFRNHKVWVGTLAFLQAVTFVPLVFFAMGSKPQFWTLFFILTFYWGAGFSAGPSWNYWMGHLVSHQEASQFFSKRTRISQIGILLGLILGGVALHNNVRLGPFTSTFGLIFFFAFCCRMTSAWLLSRKHYEPTWSHSSSLLKIRESWQMFWAQKPKRNFIACVLPFQMSIYISAPFVTPYMLVHLKMNYGQYMSAVSFMLIGKILSLWFFERVKKWNYHRAFKLGLLVLCPSPIFWSLSESFGYVVVLQLIGGAAWALFEIGLALIFFQDLKPSEKIPFLTFYNFLNAVGLLAGSALGALWLKTHAVAPENYFFLFVAGGLCRILAGSFLYRQSVKFVGRTTTTEPQEITAKPQETAAKALPPAAKVSGGAS